MSFLKTKPKTTLLFLLLALGFTSLWADPNSNTAGKLRSISGYVKDSNTGEALIGATIFIHELKTGAMTNQYGFYSLSLMPGDYTVDFSYVGYSTISKAIKLSENVKLNLELADDAKLIEEVVVKSDNTSEKLKRAEMSVTKLEMKQIKKIPALLGEVDVIKAIQLLPGVQTMAEGSSGFSVRGGAADQNLILLDEATVYNASHLMGFFSVFNNDAIKDVKLYKGDIPASYGGRLSSLLDVRMKEGNSKKFSATGGIGLLSSRITLEGPIIKDTTSFMISARRTYYDIFFPLFNNADLKNSSLYFYDLNAKINHQINANNRIYLSLYWGNDNFGFNKMMGFGFGNKTLTLRWNHQFSPRLFSNLSLIGSSYSYNLSQDGNQANSLIWTSTLQDVSAKLDFSYYANTNNSIKFGISSTKHNISPGLIEPLGNNSIIKKYEVPINYSLEHGIYASNESQITENLNIKYGIRFSALQNIGKATIYNYDSNHKYVDSTVYGSNNIFKTHYGWEPRFGVSYKLDDASSIKSSYSRTIQYLQLASNSTGGMPLDIWFTASPNVKPQIANQAALGYFRNFNNDVIEASVEVYYKEMDNAIDFKDYATLILNKRLEGEIRVGRAKSYGAEFMVQFNTNRFNGWVSYTWSHTTRKIPEINYGREFNAPYDKPHNINVVATYELTERVSISANWVFASGLPATFPTFRYEFDGIIQKGYSNRNDYRLPAYHRLDVSVTLKQKEKPFGLWEGEWVFGLYNAYNRHNPWMVNFVQEGDVTYAEKISILPVLPSVTYNFKF